MPTVGFELPGAAEAGARARAVYDQHFRDMHETARGFNGLSPSQKWQAAKNAAGNAAEAVGDWVGKFQDNYRKGCMSEAGDMFGKAFGGGLGGFGSGAGGLGGFKAAKTFCFVAGTQVALPWNTDDAESELLAQRLNLLPNDHWNKRNLALAAACGIVTVGFWSQSKRRRNSWGRLPATQHPDVSSSSPLSPEYSALQTINFRARYTNSRLTVCPTGHAGGIAAQCSFTTLRGNSALTCPPARPVGHTVKRVLVAAAGRAKEQHIHWPDPNREEFVGEDENDCFQNLGSKWTTNEPDHTSNSTPTRLRDFCLLIGTLLTLALFFTAAPKPAPTPGQQTVSLSPIGSKTNKPETARPTNPPTINIEHIEPGQIVLSRDATTGQPTAARVANVFRRKSNHLRILEIESNTGGPAPNTSATPTGRTPPTSQDHPTKDQPNNNCRMSPLPTGERIGEGPEKTASYCLADPKPPSTAPGALQRIQTTDEHPFWVHGQGWVKAGDLTLADRVLQSDGHLATITGTTYEPHPEGVEVFNIEVDHHHTYFVTAHGARAPPVWVHNKSVAKATKDIAKRARRRKPNVPDVASPTPFNGFGRVVGQAGAINPGTLPDDLAGTFAGGRYSEVILDSNTTMFRAGTAERPLGQFFDTVAPESTLQARIDKAILPEWPGGGTSPIDSVIAVRVPEGTRVYVGEVGTQIGHFVGGTQQIIVPKPWTIEGLQILGVTPLR